MGNLGNSFWRTHILKIELKHSRTFSSAFMRLYSKQKRHRNNFKRFRSTGMNENSSEQNEYIIPSFILSLDRNQGFEGSRRGEGNEMHRFIASWLKKVLWNKWSFRSLGNDTEKKIEHTEVEGRNPRVRCPEPGKAQRWNRKNKYKSPFYFPSSIQSEAWIQS